MDVHIPNLDVKQWKNCVISILGSRCSGKTYTALSIASKLGIPQWVVFCSNLATEDFWTEKLGSKGMVASQESADKRLLKIIEFQKKRCCVQEIGLIFDEYHPVLPPTEMMHTLFTNPREYNCTIITTSQTIPATMPCKCILTRSSNSLLRDVYEYFSRFHKTVYTADEFLDIAYGIFNDNQYNGFAFDDKNYHRLIPMDMLENMEWQTFFEKYDCV